jgi:carbonic anhydrase/acetyltransferase-like protein (isoleucine patch superfamily)
MSADFITTSNGARVSRGAHVRNPNAVSLGARATVHVGCEVDGALGRVDVGADSVLGAHSLLRPSGGEALTVGARVCIGARCVVEARMVGDSVALGEGARVGARAALCDGAELLPGAHLPAGATVPPGGVVCSGTQGGVVLVGELPPAAPW